MANLAVSDVKMFEQLRIPAELVAAAQIERVTNQQARDEFGITGHGDMSGLVFPYPIPGNGNHRSTCRLRRDRPESENGKPKNKYVSPFGDVRHLYFPPGAVQLLQNPNTEILFVESEKAALAVLGWAKRMALPLLPIATGGCWGWRGRIGKTVDSNGARVDETGSLADLHHVEGRKVYILFDANVATNPSVHAARQQFRQELYARGARTVIALDLPPGNWNGPDDYIAATGDDAMHEIFTVASISSQREREVLLSLIQSENHTERRTAIGTKWPAPIAEAAFIGPAGDFVRTIAPHTESDPAALLLQFLAGVGCIMGRNAYFRVEADRHYPNIFVTLVGNTSNGRKGTSYGHAKGAMERIEPNFTHNHIKGGLSSGEGIIWHLRDAMGDDPGISDKRLLVFEPEFASALKTMTRDGNTLSAQLRQAWDSGELRVLTRNSPLQATNSHVSLISHITRPELLRYLNNTELANGFGNRFLWACVKRVRLLPEGGDLQANALDGVIERVKAAIEFALTPQEIKRDSESRDMWLGVYAALSADRPGLLGSILARSEAQTMRLALLYALLDCSPAIRRRHLEAALAITDFVTASAEWIFGELYGEPDADRILEALRETPRGLTRTEINALFNRHKSQAQIEGALQTLERDQMAYRQTETTAGRYAERWFSGANKAK